MLTSRWLRRCRGSGASSSCRRILRSARAASIPRRCPTTIRTDPKRAPSASFPVGFSLVLPINKFVDSATDVADGGAVPRFPLALLRGPVFGATAHRRPTAALRVRKCDDDADFGRGQQGLALRWRRQRRRRRQLRWCADETGVRCCECQRQHALTKLMNGALGD